MGFYAVIQNFSALLQSLMESARKYLRGEELVTTTAVTITVSDCVSSRTQLIILNENGQGIGATSQGDQ